jgi:hypothetical protein
MVENHNASRKSHDTPRNRAAHRESILYTFWHKITILVHLQPHTGFTAPQHSSSWLLGIGTRCAEHSWSSFGIGQCLSPFSVVLFFLELFCFYTLHGSEEHTIGGVEGSPHSREIPWNGKKESLRLSSLFILLFPFRVLIPGCYSFHGGVPPIIDIINRAFSE